ncbi:MAG TPA: hypothetical protein V6D06_18340 [Trichocoleus sp.]
MLTVRTLKHIPTSRTIPSFRACRTASQMAHSQLQDQGRRVAGYAQMLANQAQRQELELTWRSRR